MSLSGYLYLASLILLSYTDDEEELDEDEEEEDEDDTVFQDSFNHSSAKDACPS